MEGFLAGCTDGRVLLITGRTEETVITVRERSVNEISFTVGTHETLLVPVLVLVADILQNIDVKNINLQIKKTQKTCFFSLL